MARCVMITALAAVAAFSYMRAPLAADKTGPAGAHGTAARPTPSRSAGGASPYWRLERRYWALERQAGRLGAEVRRLRRVAAVRQLQAVRGSSYALRLAASTFRVSEAEMTAVARCETADFTDFYNEGSGASGLMQFLPSTWAREGIDGFDVFDPVANALAAARIVAREGWGQWSCAPR